MGAARRLAAQHSQIAPCMVESYSGAESRRPSTPYDAKGLMKTAIRDDNPVRSLKTR